MEVVASLTQGRTAAEQCGLFTHKSVPVIFEPPCTRVGLLCHINFIKIIAFYGSCLCFWHQVEYKSFMRLEVFIVALLKVKVFLDVTLSSPRCSGVS